MCHFLIFPFIKSFFFCITALLASHIVFNDDKGRNVHGLNLKSKKYRQKLTQTNSSHVTIQYSYLKNI
ncbi:hypothetical protein CW304_28600 [Bacillus sp. UFRGS-B20]|nr:hypothetical protein CW304_28600 [Bacillus sp. UFRGS-B20]